LTLGAHVRRLRVRRPRLPTGETSSVPRRNPNELSDEESESVVYAIVRSGGQQQKVAVGDVIEIDKVAHEVGDSVTLPVLMLVDGEKVTAGADALAKATVTAEVVGATKGPKITILKYKNKTGYRKRQGHRQKYTQVKVTGINA
jgi:large subunit ribosomal protein L21